MCLVVLREVSEAVTDCKKNDVEGSCNNLILLQLLSVDEIVHCCMFAIVL